MAQYNIFSHDYGVGHSSLIFTVVDVHSIIRMITTYLPNVKDIWNFALFTGFFSLFVYFVFQIMLFINLLRYLLSTCVRVSLGFILKSVLLACRICLFRVIK